MGDERRENVLITDLCVTHTGKQVGTEGVWCIFIYIYILKTTLCNMSFVCSTYIHLTNSYRSEVSHSETVGATNHTKY